MIRGAEATPTADARAPHPDVSVVVPTFNRATRLAPLLDRLLEQECNQFTWEVLVVDNNSCDATRAVVESAMRRHPSGRLRYAFEPRRGVSYARNTGIELSSAPIILFLDDDGLPEPDWLQSMKQAFDAHPEADCIGGRVQPRWSSPPPDWFSSEHSGPLALQDRSHAAYLNASHASMCLLTANLGFRRTVFDTVGGFSPHYPRGQDRELEMRMWRADLQGLYLPAMDVSVDVPRERLTRRYHRRWHATTAHYHALMRYRDTVDAQGILREESPDARRLLGTPLFMFREWLQHAVGWSAALLGRRSKERFYHETRLWYYASFFRTRCGHRKVRSEPGPMIRTAHG